MPGMGGQYHRNIHVYYCMSKDLHILPKSVPIERLSAHPNS